MKCDELKAGIPYCDRNNNMFLYHGDEEHDSELDDEDQVYMKGEVDAAIAELKDEINRKDGVGKRWFDRCMEARAENVRLKRALWMHRAITAKMNKECCNSMRYCNPFIAIEEYKWQEVERKCRAKAEEYK